MARRALITGAGGFLGGNLAAHLSAAGWELYGGWHSQDPGLKFLPGRRVDVCVTADVETLVAEARPEVVFHLAARADPDACAADEAATRQINVQGSKLVAQAAAKAGARLIFTSTDQVCDGSRALLKEDEESRPLGSYGRSKRDAEAAVLEATGGQALVLRLALTYGWGRGQARGRGFAEQWLRRFLTGGKVQAFTDQWRSPIYAADACQALRLGAEQGWQGRLNLAGPERATRHDFALRLAREFNFPEAQVQAASMADVVFRDPRPADASLDISKLLSLGCSPRGIDAGLQAMHQELETLHP